MNPRSSLQTRGVISRTRSRLPGVLSFLLTGALFAAVLLLTFTHARAGSRDLYVRCAPSIYKVSDGETYEHRWHPEIQGQWRRYGHR